MPRSAAVDGFRLAYDRAGSGPAVVLLHGWPGDRTDFRRVVPLLTPAAQVVVPDLRGFGESDKHDLPPADAYSAAAQARSVAGLIGELGLDRPVLAGYDIGSRIAQTIAREFPERTGAIVVAPPLPGAGNRVFTAEAQREFWYQAFHQLDLAAQLVDGRPEAVRAYLRHFWSHWSGPAFTPAEADLDHLAGRYGPAGAFTASLGWYRAGAGTVATSAREQAPAPGNRITTPATVLWPQYDPLFPRAWSDRLAEFFTSADLRLIDGAGHFLPLEAAETFASAILERCRTESGQP
jgi:pimeloyl-ACP methyl ester carboxylesterase